jgi:hypothetical protein
MRVLLSALVALVVWGMPARAAVIISDTSIAVGGSVEITFSPGNFQFWETELPLIGPHGPEVPPGATIRYLRDDHRYTFVENISAPGSMEGGYRNFLQSWVWSCCNIFETEGSTIFSYAQAGVYHINYDYRYELWALNTYIINGPGDYSETGGWDPKYGTQGSGSFTVTVGAVPEPSTWAMMLIGFAGISYTLLQRNRRIGLTTNTVVHRVGGV